MTWKIEETSVKDLKRSRNGYQYDFVEYATRIGRAYKVGSNGYFIVAADGTLLPRFVVELRLPRLATPEDYAALLYAMSERSCGQMWFDSTNIDAFDLAWRMRLPLRAASPLLQWSPKSRAPGLPRGVTIAVATAAQQGGVAKLISTIPPEHGGQTPESTAHHLKRGEVLVLAKRGKVLGAAVVTPSGSKHTWVSLLVMNEDSRRQGLGSAFMGAIGKEVSQQGRLAICSMSRENVASFRGAHRLGMEVVQLGFTAQFPF